MQMPLCPDGLLGNCWGAIRLLIRGLAMTGKRREKRREGGGIAASPSGVVFLSHNDNYVNFCELIS